MPTDLAASLDVLEEARQTLVLCMRGEGGRGAQTRARCAELLLGKRFLQELTDADLLAEVKRRALRPTDG